MYVLVDVDIIPEPRKKTTLLLLFIENNLPAKIRPALNAGVWSEPGIVVPGFGAVSHSPALRRHNKDDSK